MSKKSNNEKKKTPQKQGKSEKKKEEKVTPDIDMNTQLQDELKEQKEKYLRSIAELENSRKRMQKERSDMTRYALDNVILEFIEPIDQFEKALGFKDQMSEEVKNWCLGFEMILSQLKNVLAENGVKSFDSINEQFDPHKHEAIESEETTEHADGTILQEFVKGYKSGDRILRPAKVKVAKSPNPKEPLNEENTDQEDDEQLLQNNKEEKQEDN